MHKVVVAAILFCAIPLPAAENVVALHSLYEQPALGASKLVENVTFTSGHLKVTLAQGSAAPVMAGEETIGLFFKGKGQFEYLSDDPSEAAALTSNVRKATRLGVEKVATGVAIRDAFDEAFLRIAGRELPALTGGAGADLTGAFAEHRKALAAEQTPASFAFLKQKLDAPAKPAVRVEFRGGKEIVVYRYDPAGTRRESLYVLQKIASIRTGELKDALWTIGLSSLPIGASRKDFVEPHYILVNVQYTLTASAKHDATLHVVETLVPRGAPQRVFSFEQYSRVFDSNEKPHFYRVRRVATEDGKELPFLHDRDELIVSLPVAAPPDKPFKLVFDIDGDFLIRPSGDSYWQLGTEPWFPQPGLNGQYFRVQSTLKVPKPWVPLLPGDTVSRRAEGEYNVLETKLDKPVQFLVAMAGRYTLEEETRNGLTVRVASYAGKNPRAVKELSGLAFSMIALFEKFLGPFPFREFNIIEMNDFGYGQAPPATMFITKEAFNPTLGWTSRIYSQGVNHRFAHEIAHQYWGHVVKMSTQEEQWITESFAEYSASILMKAAKGEDTLSGAWRANAKEANDWSSIATANQLRNFKDLENTFWMRTYLVYSKGAYLLSRLHAELGDKQFLTFLRTVQGKYAWRYVSTKDVIGVLKEVTGKDYTAWFDEHYWGTAMPK
ncbi:MAG TPA: M1 family aminopeptidase [Thermoanaerobaculia bacterium]|jgi:hypothetical protein